MHEYLHFHIFQRGGRLHIGTSASAPLRRKLGLIKASEDRISNLREAHRHRNYRDTTSMPCLVQLTLMDPAMWPLLNLRDPKSAPLLRNRRRSYPKQPW